MARLLVNPGTPQEWELKLKPGTNRLGRGDDNDFKIPHGSVSGSHCEMILSDAGLLLRDLGSTNGTFVNKSPVKEINLQPGQRIQLGAVEIVYPPDEAGNPPLMPVLTTTAATAPATNPPIPPPVPPTAKPGGLRISLSARPAAAAEVSTPPPPTAEPELEENLQPPAAAPAGMHTATAVFCKFHPKSSARYYCNQCRKYFCELCVSSRGGGNIQTKTCRACAVPVVAVHVHAGAAPRERGFFSRLPGTLVYPFKGTGFLILICATVVFAVLEMMTSWFTILLTMAAIGYLFCYMQNILYCTASDENEPLSLPPADGLFGAFFALACTVTLSFGPALGMLIANMFFETEFSIWTIFAVALAGCLYFPMSFLAVAMKDTVLAANPMIVIPAILKMPLQYLVTAIILMSVFAIRMVGQVMSSVAGSVALSTEKMSAMFMAFGFNAIWAFVSVYLITVNMRILGMLYVTQRHKFGWFSR
jgi:hypothetical protein